MSIVQDIKDPFNIHVIDKKNYLKRTISINENTENLNENNKFINNLLSKNIKEIPIKEQLCGPPYILIDNSTTIEFYQNNYGTECIFYVQNVKNLNLNLKNITKISTYMLDNNTILLKGIDIYLKKDVYILIV